MEQRGEKALQTDGKIWKKGGRETSAGVCCRVSVRVCVCASVRPFMCNLSDLKGAGNSCRSPAVTLTLKHNLSLED